MWFDKDDINISRSITIEDIHGYVLPHAGTKHTGHILSHTLRFKPKKNFSKVIILFYPSFPKPNVNGKYYHEYYVPWKTLDYVFKDHWNIKNIQLVGYNLKKISVNLSYLNLDNTLIIVSADFSHYIPLDEAIEKENKAAHSLMFNNFTKSDYINVVDDVKSFKQLYHITKRKNWTLQWIGRTRSEGLNAVGYLSFLIRENANPKKDLPDGMFVTVYDKKMNTRECLGEWFDSSPWNTTVEKNLINKVIRKGRSPSRLYPHLNENKLHKNKIIPLTNYTITYLYKDKKPFIRGWHGVQHEAFFLPDVFLENTYNNGKWIDSYDKVWGIGNRFYMRETLNRLRQKANSNINGKNYNLFSSKVSHVKL